MSLDLAGREVLTFDCYGTLIDWETGILEALRPILQRHRVRETPDRILALFGQLEAALEAGPYLPYREILGRVLLGLGARLDFAPTTAEVESFALSVADWPAFPDSAAALAALRSRFRLAVISNVDDDLFTHSARRLGSPFERVITAQQAGSYKPSLANFRLALDRIGVPPEKVVHVAQSLFHDVAPATRLGLATVWVNRRHDRPGPGATPPATARPDLEVPDLASLAAYAGVTSA